MRVGRRLVCGWFVLVGFCLPGHASAVAVTEPLLPRAAACFAPGTRPEVIEAFAARLAPSSPTSSLQVSPDMGPPAFTFNDVDRWSQTATNPCCLTQGDPTTITWSIVPDGTPIPGYNAEPGDPSNLRAFLNAIYGNQGVWLPIFQQVFDRWGQLTGVTYVYEPNDDGAAWTSGSPSTPGQIGVRGDVRIGGHYIDGNSNILAYNFYPQSGEMVIDTGDNFYTNTATNSLRLRNVLAHEHGHGLGLRHVCPVSQTKLMEPFLSVSFDGPQHDDILATNRGYGDDNEGNDTAGAATALGAISGPAQVTSVSIDDNSDGDFLSFTAAPGTLLDVTLSPVGATYLSGSQNMGGSCSAGTNFNSLIQNNLGVQVLASDGSSVLAMSTSSPIGVAESVNDVDLGSGGTFFVNVIPGFESAAQLYQLSLNVQPFCTTPNQSLSAQTVSSFLTVIGCSITAGNGYVVAGSGNVTFSAKTFIALTDGFRVSTGGIFTAEMDPLIP
ncbi:MAG TPA: matrixin family metalloprotease [Vicinamibacteria bacterium]|nr:matrixin family metalloprotease [Vicinamibacteria bacterium]